MRPSGDAGAHEDLGEGSESSAPGAVWKEDDYFKLPPMIVFGKGL